MIHIATIMNSNWENILSALPGTTKKHGRREKRVGKNCFLLLRAFQPMRGT